MRRCLLAALIAAVPAVTLAGPGAETTACVDLAARHTTGTWMRLVATGEPCRANETPMSIVVLRQEPFVFDAAVTRPSRPGPTAASRVLVEEDATLRLNRPLLVAANVLAQNDGAGFTQTAGTTRSPVRVRLACDADVDGRPAGQPLRLNVLVATAGDTSRFTRRLPRTAPPPSLPDALGSTLVERHAIGSGRHVFAVTCSAAGPLHVRGQVSLIVLQY